MAKKKAATKNPPKKHAKKPFAESQTFVTYLTSLAHPELTLNRLIPVTIRRDDAEYVASFLDANISSGGETLQLAIKHLQSLIVDFFVMHEEEDAANLGPSMKQQRTVLMELICRHLPKATPKRRSKSSAEKPDKG